MTTVKTIMTIEERYLVRDYVLLPYIEKIVQKSIADIEYSSNVLKRLYLAAGHALLAKVVNEKYRLRRELKRRNITVGDEEHSDFVVYHKCICRGYDDNLGMTRDVMRTEISVKLTKFTAELAAFLKEKTT